MPTKRNRPAKNRSQQATSRQPSVSAGLREESAAPAGPLLSWAELGLGLLLTVLVLSVQVAHLFHAGPLWRDEIQIVNLANMSPLSEMWDKNEHDTFPLLWQMTVRSWTAVGLGRTDFGLRMLGLLVGLAMVAGLWWTVRQYGCGAPLVSLVLFALSPPVVRFGNSLRGYGLGVVMLLLMLGAVWRLVEEPTRRRFLLALGVVLLAVQTMYFNAALLLALGAGSAAVSLRRRTWKPVAAVVAIGLIAAVSLLPYLDPLSRAKQWNDIQKGPFSLAWILARFADAVTAYGDWMLWVWIGLLALAVAGCCYRLARSVPPETGEEKDAAVFLGVTMLCGTALYAGVLLSARVPTQAWYYLAIMGFLAVVSEAAVDLLVRRSRKGRIARIILALGVAALIAPRVWREAHVRMTDVDLIAAHLEQAAAKEDLILLSPWQPGVTFTRYYHGQTPWTTLPEMGGLSVQRYDIFKKRMGEREPIQPLLQKIAQTLSAGHTLWIIGGLRFLLPTEQPGDVPPLPQGPLSEGVYDYVWSRQAAYFVQSHAQSVREVPISVPGPVYQFENTSLLKVEGWR